MRQMVSGSMELARRKGEAIRGRNSKEEEEGIKEEENEKDKE